MNKRQTGFTLIELMVALSVLAILLTTGVPNIRSTIENNRLTAVTNNLVASLNIARSEAVKQGLNSTICTSNDQSSCTASAWTSGWLIWVDSNNNSTLDAPEEIIRAAEAWKGTMTVTAANTTIGFSSTGLTNTPGILKICDSRTGNLGKQLRILAGGSVSLTTAVACP